MESQESPAEKAHRVSLESLSSGTSTEIQGELAKVPGYDLEYTQHIVAALIGIAYGTHRLHPAVDLEWVHIPEKQNPDGVAYALHVLRDIALAPIISAAAALYPPEEGRLNDYERFIHAACLMIADHLLDQLRADLIP